MARQLNAGDKFPPCSVQTIRHGTLHIPADLKGEYAVILFYRGVW